MGTRWMERSGSKSIVRFRRARAVLILVILFWIWLLTGGAGGLTALAGSPNALVLALYAGAVVVPVSALAGLTAGAMMLAEWPRRSGRAAGGARVSKLAQAMASARVTLVRLPPWILRATLARLSTHARLPALPRISKLPALPHISKLPALPRISELPALPRISELPGVKLLRLPVPSRRSASPRPARFATDPTLPSRPPAPKAAPEPIQGPAAPRTSVPARPRRVPGIPAPPVRLPGQATRIPAAPDCPPGIGTAGNAGNGGGIAS